MMRRIGAAVAACPVGIRRWPGDGGELGVLERWYASQPTTRVAAAVVQLAEPVAMVALRAALRRLGARHRSRLQVTLGSRAGKLHFVPLPAGTDVPLIHDKRSEVWPLAEAMVGEPFSKGGALYRVAATAGRRGLVVLFHHVIADGEAVASFVAALLDLLAGHSSSERVVPAVLAEACADIRPTLGLLAAECAVELRSRGAQLYRGGFRNVGPLTTGLAPMTLVPSELRELAAAAQQQRTTVHGALCAAAMMVASRTAADPTVPIGCVSPVSLRRRSQPAPNAARGLGVFVGAHESSHVLGVDPDLWALARSYRAQLGAAIPALSRRVGLLAFAGDLRKRALRMEANAPNGRTTTVEVSNLGRQQLGVGGAQVWFVQGNHYHGPLYNLSVVTDWARGEMQLCLAYPRPLVDPPQARSFLSDMQELLRVGVSEICVLAEGGR